MTVPKIQQQNKNYFDRKGQKTLPWLLDEVIILD